MLNPLDLLFPPRVDERLLRETPLDAFLSRMQPSAITTTRPATAALFAFSDPVVRSALHEAKYHGNRRAFGYLGAALADFLTDRDEGRCTSSIMIPIPLGKKRARERGFNQVEETIRAALPHLPTDTTLTLETTLLVRTRETVSQVSLERERREANVRNAFLARALRPDATYLLIDDVLTTGATLQAAIDALTAAGARTILPLALAH